MCVWSTAKDLVVVVYGKQKDRVPYLYILRSLCIGAAGPVVMTHPSISVIWYHCTCHLWAGLDWVSGRERAPERVTDGYGWIAGKKEKTAVPWTPLLSSSRATFQSHFQSNYRPSTPHSHDIFYILDTAYARPRTIRVSTKNLIQLAMHD